MNKIDNRNGANISYDVDRFTVSKVGSFIGYTDDEGLQRASEGFHRGSHNGQDDARANMNDFIDGDI